MIHFGWPSELHLEEVVDEVHDLFLECWKSSKDHVLCEMVVYFINDFFQMEFTRSSKRIMEEFNYLNIEEIGENEEAIEVPTTAIITSFLSYLRCQQKVLV